MDLLPPGRAWDAFPVAEAHFIVWEAHRGSLRLGYVKGPGSQQTGSKHLLSLVSYALQTPVSPSSSPSTVFSWAPIFQDSYLVVCSGA